MNDSVAELNISKFRKINYGSISTLFTYVIAITDYKRLINFSIFIKGLKICSRFFKTSRHIIIILHSKLISGKTIMNTYKELIFEWPLQFYSVLLEVIVQSKSKYLMSNSKSNSEVRIHKYNPFDNIYTSEKFSSVDKLFPVAINNFHGYQLKL